jgi:hypothetical protein
VRLLCIQTDYALQPTNSALSESLHSETLVSYLSTVSFCERPLPIHGGSEPRPGAVRLSYLDDFQGGWTSSEAKVLVPILRIWAAYEMVMNAHAAGPSVHHKRSQWIGLRRIRLRRWLPSTRDLLADMTRLLSEKFS